MIHQQSDPCLLVAVTLFLILRSEESIATFGAAEIKVLSIQMQMQAFASREVDLAVWILNHDVIHLVHWATIISSAVLKEIPFHPVS